MEFARFIKELLVVIIKEQKGLYYYSLAYAELPIPDRLSIPLGFLYIANGAFSYVQLYVFLDEMKIKISTWTSCLLLCSPSIA